MASIKRPQSTYIKPIKAHDSFYDSPRWRRFRKEFFSISTLCDYCHSKGIARIARTLDHLLNRRMWPELEWEESNLKRACPTCDNRKRQIEGKHFDKESLLHALKCAGYLTVNEKV